jgi:hypothetical protein
MSSPAGRRFLVLIIELKPIRGVNAGYLKKTGGQVQRGLGSRKESDIKANVKGP